ncbi:hypothetical protein BQ8794_30082 [Mesorhizobium prunaredense]|uniref:Uncharacterized protein n=1 Tax=Mesorhizobium prunaredense TaxID=1631249 RepID=A0A1R3V9P2_9HYPH|nr:hypothetical protein BQ8794_30082 [Mesorhizobium prunaredense]
MVFENRSGAYLKYVSFAHDPENRNRFSERIMRKSKDLQRPLRVQKTRGAVGSAENRASRPPE